MFTIGALIAIAIGGLIGLILGKLVIAVYRDIVRALDKNKIKGAMAREAYWNNLYEETLCEEMDKMAVKAAKDMSRYDRY